MNKGFVFEAGISGGEDQWRRAPQSPWEFSGYAKASEEEHRERNTTSIDQKIRQRLNAGKQGNGKHDSEEEEEDDDEYDERLEESWAEGRQKKNVVKESEPESEDDSENESGASEDEDGPESEDEGRQINQGKRKTNAVKTISKMPETTKKPGGFYSSAEGASFSASTFMELNISRPLVRACEALGYRQPTPIQAACIPLALSGRDICGSAVTGSGKTAAFALPILERLLFRPRRVPAIRVLIITPTRELAVQLHSMIEKLGQFTDIRCCLVVGGLSSKVQEVALRSHPDIVVATPGRMIDHLRNTHSVGLEDLAILVLDEADRLLELGFREEIHELVQLCPSRRQTMLFSATMTNEVSELIKLSLKSPVRLSADPNTQRPSTLTEEVIRIREGHEEEKEAVLLSLCSRAFTGKTIVFSGTKIEAHRLKILFGLSGLKAAELHGNLTQAQRLEALESFRKQEVDFLIATDVAARGLDIIGVQSVINFESPKDITTYVHRVGRTARAGRQGRAVTLMTEHDRPLLKAVVKRAGSKLQKRVVAAASVASWHQRIKDFEEDLAQIIRQEREEKVFRKAEMEANKAQNMVDHEAEIFSRPKKTWFQSDHDKSRIAVSSKQAKEPPAKKKGISVEEAEKIKMKEKRKAEREKNLPRRKRRRLEAAREAAEDEEEVEHEDEDGKQGGKQEKKSRGELLVDVGYRRAKAAKAVEKAKQDGRFMAKKRSEKKKASKSNQMVHPEDGESSRSNNKSGGGRSQKKPGLKRKPGVTKRSFKSKGRYKRR